MIRRTINPAIIRDCQRKGPFTPFRLCHLNGTSCAIYDPCNLVVTADPIAIATAPDRATNLPLRTLTILPIQIVSLQPIPLTTD